ncbi:hypothetical protein LLH00_01650 [bacterium]|nr:hypothetical protein [bacterium]
MSFTFDKDVIEVQNLDTMASFARFHAINAGVFLDGIILAEDLLRDKGAIVLSHDTELTHENFKRLLSMREANPKINFCFRLKRGDKILAKFRQEIMERLMVIMDRRIKTKLFRDLFSLVSADLTAVADLALASPDLVLTVHQMRLSCESSKLKKSLSFLDQALNSAILALALTRTPLLKEYFGNEREKAVPLFSAALIHNYGAIMNLAALAEQADQDRAKLYWTLILKDLKKIEKTLVDENLRYCLEALCSYQLGRRDFVTGEDYQSICANILVVVEYFLRRECGLFGEPDEPRRVVDRMNVKAFEHQLNDRSVQALTLSLNLKDIFDFYSEMERLLAECPYDSATAYPLTGFRSPTLFVCRKRVTACRWIELSVRAVKLIVKLGELAPNDYHRCKLLTPKLMDFYSEFYDEIKEETSGQQPKAVEPIKVTAGPPPENAPKPGEVAPAKAGETPAQEGVAEAAPAAEAAGGDKSAPFNDSLSQMFNKLSQENASKEGEPSAAKSKTQDTPAAG